MREEDEGTERLGDAALVRRLRAGEELAFRELHAAHAPRLLRLVGRMLHDKSLAEEVVQDTFVAVFQNIAGYRSEARLATWITSIALRRAQNAQRGRGRREAAGERVGQQQADARGAAEQGERDLARRVLALMDRLDPEKRTALLLFAEGYTAAEIAAISGEPRGTILSRLSRSRTELAELMAQAGLAAAEERKP